MIPVGNRPARDDFEPLESASVSLRPCVSTMPMTTSAPSRRFCPGRGQHFIGLADARRGAEKNLQAARVRRVALPAREPRAKGAVRRYCDCPCPAVLDFQRPYNARARQLLLAQLVEREIELQHIDVRLADDAEEAPRRIVLDEGAELRPPASRAPWRRAAPGTEPRPGVMSGSRPLADVVTRSTGIGAQGFVGLQAWRHRPSTRSISAFEVGPYSSRRIARRRRAPAWSSSDPWDRCRSSPRDGRGNICRS